MKKIFFGLVLSLSISTSVIAESLIGSDVCLDHSLLSGKIMEARQAGTPMSSIINIFGSDELLRIRVIDAYSGPRMSSVKYQVRKIEDFTNDAYLECIKLLNNS